MSWLRHPKTTQEKRASFYAQGVKVRARRNFVNLPDVRDDMFRWYSNQRSWKVHRKTQYKITLAGKL